MMYLLSIIYYLYNIIYIIVCKSINSNNSTVNDILPIYGSSISNLYKGNQGSSKPTKYSSQIENFS